jgi:DUF4097 and DUF4098 domain-containing protein YvlB
MKKMIGLTIAAVLVATGALIFVIAMSMNGWDFKNIGSSRFETNTHAITEDFSVIDIQTDTADIAIFPSEDGSCSVVCYEREMQNHTVEVEGGRLSVKIKDTRKWYQSLFNFGQDKISVYLPKAEYASLFLKTDTGDVEIADFEFGTVEILGSTGDIKSSASVDGIFNIKMSTGDVKLTDLTAGELVVKCSTGDIKIENIAAKLGKLSVSTGKVSVTNSEIAGDVTIKVSTGKAYLENLRCESLTSNGDTGDISLKNVIATGKMNIERSTGDVKFDASDAEEITVKTSTGSVKGTLLSEKVFVPRSDTGDIEVPKTKNGGFCEITTDTGNIIISLVTD